MLSTPASCTVRRDDGELVSGVAWRVPMFARHGALPRLPGAILDLVGSPWLEVQVIRRPQSVPPDFHVDPAWMAYGLWIVWGSVVLVIGRRLLRPGPSAMRPESEAA